MGLFKLDLVVINSPFLSFPVLTGVAVPICIQMIQRRARRSNQISKSCHSHCLPPCVRAFSPLHPLPTPFCIPPPPPPIILLADPTGE